MKLSSVFCLTSSLLFALSINFRADAHGLEAQKGVDKETFITMTGIDDFVLPPSGINDESVWVAGIRTTFITKGVDTNGRYTLAEFYIPSQAGVPAHIHRREDEWFYVLNGDVSIEMEDELVDATSGTLVYGPRDHIHSFANMGTTPATMLSVWTPSGIEGLFKEVGDPVSLTDPFSPPAPPDIPKLLAAAPRYGLEFVNTNPTPVPEPSYALGILAFFGFGAIAIRKCKLKSFKSRRKNKGFRRLFGVGDRS
ncbi:cupin domain-containing protein [Nostoc sp.]|uniref:cupin domain-containing protein n=1 Tax=Nostoc sp. TaxID=1180 RepID=UPI002FF80751